MVVKAFIKMIRDVSSVVNDVSATTIINANAITSIQENQTWGEITIGTTKLLEPSANDISGVLLGNTIIQGTDLSGIIIGDGNDAQTSYSIALGQGAIASGTEKFVYRDVCNNRFVFDTAAGGQFLINGTAPSGGGGGGGTTVPGDLLVHGTMETSGVILAPAWSAEGGGGGAFGTPWLSVISDLDPSTNPLMTKGMLWINKARSGPCCNTWWTTSYMDISRSLAGAAALGGKLYVVGGVNDDPTFPTLPTEVEVYDPINNSWSYVASMSNGLEAPGVAALGGKLYVLGGTPYTTTSHVYDPSENSWNSIAPMQLQNRSHLCVAALGRKLYAVGGQITGAPWVAQTNEVYDPADNSWNNIALMNTQRWYAMCAALGGKLYVTGGKDWLGNELKTTEVYDPLDNSWNYVADMNVERWGAFAAALGGKFYVVGGGPAGHGGTGEVYDPINNTWNYINNSTNRAGRGFTGAALGGSLFLVGGLSISAKYLSRVEVRRTPLVQMPQITYRGEDFYISHQRGGPKTFVIPHPEHEGKMLRHACLEAPTRGTNVYEYQITTTEDNQTTEIDLPSYFKHINGRPRVYVYSGTGSQWGGSRGYMSDDHTKAVIETEKPGTYNVMVTGVRKDPEAVAYSATENIDNPIDPKDI